MLCRMFITLSMSLRGSERNNVAYELEMYAVIRPVRTSVFFCMAENFFCERTTLHYKIFKTRSAPVNSSKALNIATLRIHPPNRVQKMLRQRDRRCAIATILCDRTERRNFNHRLQTD